MQGEIQRWQEPPSAMGNYVLYTDHAKIVAALRKRCEAADALADRVVWVANDMNYKAPEQFRGAVPGWSDALIQALAAYDAAKESADAE